MMKILVAGDYCPQERVADLIEEDKGMSVLEEVLPYLTDADYSIVNFECAVADKTVRPIVKFGPCLSCTSKGIKLLKDVGFNGVTLANNHFRDYRDVGVRNTLMALKSYGIDYVGGGESITEAEKVLYKVIDGKKLAVVNFCENEFSIATKNRCGSAPMDAVANYCQITEARKNADIVIVIVHGGHEGFQYPSPRMKKLYRWYVDLGADIVINGHQHCFSGYEVYNGSPIFYGLGNFCFDEDGSRDSLWNYGFFICLSIQDNDIKFECIPYEQCNQVPSVKLLKGKSLIAFHEKLNEINSVISDDTALEDCYKAFCEKRRNQLSCLAPYLNEHTRAAAGRGWLPYLLPKKKLLNILNFIECESHRDLLINSIEKQIYHDEEDC